MTWSTPRLGRVRDAGGILCTCERQTKAHPASYRAESVNDETGEVRTAMLCTNRAATVAGLHGLEFPPGQWRRPE